MNRSGLSETDIDKLLDSIKWAAADYEWERVRKLTTQLLQRQDLPPQTRVAMLRQRGTALSQLGFVHEAQRDLETAVTVAEEASLLHDQIDALNHLSFYLSSVMRDGAEGLRYAKIALDLAQRSGTMAQVADSHFALADVYTGRGILYDQFLSHQHAQQALSLAQQSGNKMAEAGSYDYLARIAARRDGKSEQAEDLVQKSVSLYLEIGQPYHASRVHNGASAYINDLNLQLKHNLQGLHFAREANSIDNELLAGNNRAFFLWQFGLYHSAEQLVVQVVNKAREINLPNLPSYVATLVECSLLLGKYDQTPTLLEEMRSLGLSTDYLALLSGMTALGSGDHETAITHLQEAVPEDGTDKYGVAPTALAWLGAAELAAGDIVGARQHTAEAVSLSEIRQTIYPLQEVWWWHYRASYEWQVASGKLQVASGEDTLPDVLFEILDRAGQEMLDYIAGISDEGLRRSYLNKVPINHDITLEWTSQAAARGHSLAPFTERETKPESFEEQFQRLVEIGNNLTAERDPRTLPDTIRNEFVALSGAERAVVTLRNEAGELNWASRLGLEAEDEAEDRVFISPFLNKARELRLPKLYGSEGDVPQGGVPELHLRSVLALPLVSQGRLWGVLYGDMRHIFGRFTEQDLALLNLLANQAAAALENADWVRGLEQKVEERTAELRVANRNLAKANAQAEEARQIAEEANEAKSAFLASMSHELRTPLNAIIGFTRIVKRKLRRTAPEKQLSNLGKVLASAEHLLGLINTVLDLAKIEAGHMDMLPSEYEVEALVEMCLATAQPLARPNVQMVASVPSDLPTAYSDQDKIRQILLNTLSNAAKFTHKGSITLRVEQQDGLLLYEVIDSGIGMNEEQLARVFEEFQQAESTTSRDYGGTGLGLPISKQLAQLLGGDLAATSVEGKGSTFTLSIPIRLD